MVAFLGFAFYISTTIQGDIPSTINNSGGGLSVFYKTLGQLKLPVSSSLKPLKESHIEDVQIVAQGGSFDINSSETMDWVDRGGTLVYLTSDNMPLYMVSFVPDIKGNLKIYHSKKGRIIIAETSSVTNKTLLNNTNKAYELLNEINSMTYRNIVFSESYLFSAAEHKTMWDFVPLQGKYIIYQFCLVLIAFFYYKGKRFGKSLVLYEEVERTENEYLHSTAALYSSAECLDLILESYYKSLLKDIIYANENWLEYWERENLKELDKAKKLYQIMTSKPIKLKRKEYIELINNIELLKDILKKRREIDWKTLKNTR